MSAAVSCIAPLAEGGTCGRPAVRRCTHVAFPAAGGRLVCGAPICGDVECSRNHYATEGMTRPESLDDWRRLHRRSLAAREALHGAARGRGTGL